MASHGLKLWDIGVEREAPEVECDNGRTAIRCGEPGLNAVRIRNNLWLAMVTGWAERRNAKGAWLCPQCTHRNVRKRQGSPERLDLRVV